MNCVSNQNVRGGKVNFLASETRREFPPMRLSHPCNEAVAVPALIRKWRTLEAGSCRLCPPGSAAIVWMHHPTLTKNCRQRG